MELKSAVFGKMPVMGTLMLLALMLLGTHCGGGVLVDTTNPNPNGNTNARTFTFINQCPFTVWVGTTGADAGPCDSSGSCETGRECGPGNRCFWVFPQPSSGSAELAANTGMATYSLPAAEYIHPTSNVSIQWSGNLFGRTGCDGNGENCQTADCNGNPCKVGVGGRPPATLAEFTLQNQLNDVYDISTINGINLPLSMSPEGNGSYQNAPTGNNEADYWCANPGDPTPSSPVGPIQLKGCPWQITPPSIEYQFVAQGGLSCSNDGQCGSQEKCGLAIPAVAPGGNGQSTCGAMLGYWTAVSICGLNPNFGTPFDCATAVPAANGNYGTLTHLFGCVLNEPGTPGAQSCYTQGASGTCCGCENWAGLPATGSCESQNSFWQAQVLPKIQFLKNACPNAYAYQYDDKTSTFTCQTSESPNQVNYTIHYCPGGNTGL